MNRFVIDASVAVKWLVEEGGTSEALTLRQRARLIAPELLVAECANILKRPTVTGRVKERSPMRGHGRACDSLILAPV